MKTHKPTQCPGCGSPVDLPDILQIAWDRGLTEAEEIVLQTVWEGGGLPVQTNQLIDAMYEYEPDGGPSPSAAFHAVHRAIDAVQKKLTGSGVKIWQRGPRQGWRVKIL